MVTKLSAEQLEQICEAFRVVDADGDGYVTATDLVVILESFGFHHSETDLTLFLNDLSVNLEKNGCLDLYEFVLWINKLGLKLEDDNLKLQLKKEEVLATSLETGRVTRKEVKIRGKLLNMQKERHGFQEILDQERKHSAKLVFDLIDVDKKGYIVREDLRKISEELGENWDSAMLDSMMASVTKKYSVRVINLEAFEAILDAQVAWDEPDHYHFQTDMATKAATTKSTCSIL